VYIRRIILRVEAGRLSASLSVASLYNICAYPSHYLSGSKQMGAPYLSKRQCCQTRLLRDTAWPTDGRRQMCCNFRTNYWYGWGLGVRGWGLGVGGWGLRIGDWWLRV